MPNRMMSQGHMTRVSVERGTFLTKSNPVTQSTLEEATEEPFFHTCVVATASIWWRTTEVDREHRTTLDGAHRTSTTLSEHCICGQRKTPFKVRTGSARHRCMQPATVFEEGHVHLLTRATCWRKTLMGTNRRDLKADKQTMRHG